MSWVGGFEGKVADDKRGRTERVLGGESSEKVQRDTTLTAGEGCLGSAGGSPGVWGAVGS